MSILLAGAAQAANPKVNPDPVPTITSVSPAMGSADGGTVVTVRGTGFTDDSTDPSESVAFIAPDGTVYVAAFTYVSATSLTVTAPPVSATGTYGIAVMTAGGQSAETAADDFAYLLAAGSAPTISGPATTTYGSTVTLTGQAAPGDTVTLHTHGPGGSFATGASTTATADGTYSIAYTATSDQRYYTAVGSNQSPYGLTQVAPTVAGSAAKVVPLDSRTTISGTAGVGNGFVSVHFHKAGTAADDYSIVRPTTVNASTGAWSYTYTASVDYRFYATSVNGLRTATYLYQAR